MCRNLKTLFNFEPPASERMAANVEQHHLSPNQLQMKTGQRAGE